MNRIGAHSLRKTGIACLLVCLLPAATHAEGGLVPATPVAPRLQLVEDWQVREGGPAFYRAVGRPDLAQRFEDRAGAKSFARWMGAVAATGALLWSFGIFLNNFDCCGGPRKPQTPYTGPGILSLAALSAIVIPGLVPTDPLDGSERVALATAHNKKAVSMAPQVFPGGAGVVLAQQF